MKKLLLIAACVAFMLSAPAVPSPAIAADDILISDFEAADYGDWKVEGKAFGRAPAKGTLAGQMQVTGFEGKGLVNSFLGGDQLVHNLDCDFSPNKDAIDWWTYLDMEEYNGKTAKVVAMAAPEICKLIESNDEIRHLMPLYDEALRPQFHMSRMRGWNNDPNGMCYYDGQYHFFWQCNPAGRNWANMYWGHATSPDMVHWTEQDRALRSGGGNVKNRHPKMADRNCFSGSGNVELYNTSGWQKGDEKPIVLAFTDTGCGESLAYSTGRGKTWTYYEGNPVIQHSGRDPKLVWYEPGKHWVIAVFDQDKEHGRKHGTDSRGTGRRDMGKPLGTISLTAEGGSLTVESLKAYEMTPAWKRR